MPPRRQRVYPLDAQEFVVLMTNKIRQIPQDLLRLLWDTYLELYAQMLTDRTNDRNRLRDSLDEAGF